MIREGGATVKAETQTFADRPGAAELGTMFGGRPGAAERERLQQNWVLLLAMGVALVVIGAAVVSEPEMTFIATNLVVQLLGVLLVLGGIFQVAGSLWARQWRGFFVHLLAGVIYFVVGVLMIGKTDEAAAALTLMVACALLVGGVLRIVLSVLQRFDGWGWVLLNGVVSLILGAAIWRHWPDSGEWVIGLFVGIEMLFGGLSWVMLALRVRSEPKAPLPA
jgi:uncharacterized membrane protein HdeD (DUF308 family)